MFRTPSAEVFASEPAIRKLLHLVLLMAARDRARCCRFEPSSTVLQMWYCCPGDNGELTWFALVPPPPTFWEPLVTVFRESCEVAPLPGWFDGRNRGTRARLVGWFEKKPPACDAYPYFGTLVQELETYRCEWSLLLDTRRPIPSAIMIPMSDYPDVETATDLLKQLMRPDGTLHL